MSARSLPIVRSRLRYCPSGLCTCCCELSATDRRNDAALYMKLAEMGPHVRKQAHSRPPMWVSPRGLCRCAAPQLSAVGSHALGKQACTQSTLASPCKSSNVQQKGQARSSCYTGRDKKAPLPRAPSVPAQTPLRQASTVYTPCPQRKRVPSCAAQCSLAPPPYAAAAALSLVSAAAGPAVRSMGPEASPSAKRRAR